MPRKPAVLDNSRAPCRKVMGVPGQRFAGGAEGGERHLVVLDASDVLHDAFHRRRSRVVTKCPARRAHTAFALGNNEPPWSRLLGSRLWTQLLPPCLLNGAAKQLFGRIQQAMETGQCEGRRSGLRCRLLQIDRSEPNDLMGRQPMSPSLDIPPVMMRRPAL